MTFQTMISFYHYFLVLKTNAIYIKKLLCFTRGAPLKQCSGKLGSTHTNTSHSSQIHHQGPVVLGIIRVTFGSAGGGGI